MRQERNAATPEEAPAIRLAWWGAFFATVALVAILGLARSAEAMTIPPDPSTAALTISAPEEEEFEGEEEGEEEEFTECEFAESEEEQEECEAEAEEEGAEAPRECILSSAIATVTADLNSNKVRLVVRYTAYVPGSVEVAFWLRGAKGPLSLGSERSHIGTRGVIRDTNTLSAAQMAKVLAARNYTIELRPTHAPRSCNSLLDRHLTVRRNASGRLTWSDPGSPLIASR